MGNFYVPGDWNAICDICGFEHKASTLRKNWKGQMVCPQDFETRHPQDFLRVRSEDTSVPWTRVDPTETFVGVGEPLLVETGDLIITDEALSPILTEE